MKSDKRLDQAWTVEYGDIMYTTLPGMSECIIIMGVKRCYFFFINFFPDYDVAPRARKARKGVKNKHLKKNKKKKK